MTRKGFTLTTVRADDAPTYARFTFGPDPFDGKVRADLGGHWVKIGIAVVHETSGVTNYASGSPIYIDHELEPGSQPIRLRQRRRRARLVVLSNLVDYKGSADGGALTASDLWRYSRMRMGWRHTALPWFFGNRWAFLGLLKKMEKEKLIIAKQAHDVGPNRWRPGYGITGHGAILLIESGVRDLKPQ